MYSTLTIEPSMERLIKEMGTKNHYTFVIQEMQLLNSDISASLNNILTNQRK